MASAAVSHMRLSPYLRGIVFGMSLTGASVADILAEVCKQDGSRVSQQGVRDCIATCKSHGGIFWNGELSAETHAGRPRKTTIAEDNAIKRLVVQNRGKAKVTVAFVRKKLPKLRSVSASLVERRLGEAGFAFLMRRKKSIVTAEHKAKRIEWAEWVSQRQRSTLDRWAYTDGTVFYLARTQAEQASKVRASLGGKVWRQFDGSDAMFEDCVGPSAYWKAQGYPVRAWGLLICGRLSVAILPAGTAMNRHVYANLISTRFGKWIANGLGDGVSAFLLQDHERCLWAPEPRQAMKAINLSLLENYPKCSQDLNPIESVWKLLRDRLDETIPIDSESREQFVPRLRQAVAWINRNHRDALLHLCACQKDWARDVLQAKGARTLH